MTKTISQIKDEISNFYLSIQDEVTDVSTGSVAGGFIYAVSAALKEIYDDLDRLESQAYISTATGNYLDLLIEGGFFLPRPGSTRSTGYVLVYADDPIVDTRVAESGLICVDYDYDSEEFLGDITPATKFTGTNSFGSNAVSYALITPRNPLYSKRDSSGRIIVDLKGKNAQYLLLPVASIIKGRQANVDEGALNTFSNPPQGLNYVVNINNPSEIIFNYGGVSTAPLYSRNTTMTSFELLTKSFKVINAFNFSSQGFLEISYLANQPTKLINATYESSTGESIFGGLVFDYSSKNQTNIVLASEYPLIRKYTDNVLTDYHLKQFTYDSIVYTVDSSDVWRASENVFRGSDVFVGPSTPISPTVGGASGTAKFFSEFFNSSPWVLQQRREQVSADVIYDPDNVLSESYSLREGFRLSSAQDRFNDSQYRNYFQQYINSLPRGTNSALEFAALQVPGISFAKSVPSEEIPIGKAILLASSENGQLPNELKQAVVDYLKDDWVSAGVSLSVTAPDLAEFILSVSVALTNERLENSVRTNIRSSIISYLSSKSPEDEIKFGEIYSIISNLTGVKNVSDLIIGKYSPDHYVDYRYNYAKTALKKFVSYNPTEYFHVEQSSFSETLNEVTISTDISNGFYFESVPFSSFESSLNEKYLFGKYNDVPYGAVSGIFSSDGGGSITVSSDYNVTFSYSLDSVSSDNLLGISFNVDSSDAEITLNVNGTSVVTSDVNEFRNVFVSLPVFSTDVSISFSSSSSVSVTGIQTFLHDDLPESHMIGKYSDLVSLPFIDESKVDFVANCYKKSSKYLILELFGKNQESFPGKLQSLFKSLSEAESISLFKTVLRDFQYGRNASGKNSNFFSNSFADTSQSDFDFSYFLSYVTTSPLSLELSSLYPLVPKETKNNEIGDYTLSSTEITRFNSIIVNPSLPLSENIGINIE